MMFKAVNCIKLGDEIRYAQESFSSPYFVHYMVVKM